MIPVESWLDYLSGSIAAILVFWLMLYGVRKRSYSSHGSKLVGWLSAHIYMGLFLMVVATIHSNFSFGANIHAATYILVMIVVLSGLFGSYAYTRYPRLIGEVSAGLSMEEMVGQLSDLDRKILELGLKFDDRINDLLLKASEDSRLGTSLREKIMDNPDKCLTASLANRLKEHEEQIADEESYRRLLSLIFRKTEMLGRARKIRKLEALNRIWQFVHVPFSFALLAALISHVFIVFYYGS